MSPFLKFMIGMGAGYLAYWYLCRKAEAQKIAKDDTTVVVSGVRG